jgi:hypothetical protein
MADDTEQKSSVPLPPKLDLRRSGVLKDSPAPAAPAAVSSAAMSSTTLHIKMQDELPTVRVAAAPADAPSVVIKSQPAPTIEIRKPVAQPSVAPAMSVKPLVIAPGSAPAAERKPASKSETSRIPLELATPAAAPAASAVNVKTIRVKPAGGTASLGIQMAAAQPALTSKPIDDKRKTSRISLESALAMEDKGADKGAPKTIWLKKLGDATGKAVNFLGQCR